MVHYEADFQAAKNRVSRPSDLELEIEVIRRVVHAIEMLEDGNARRRVARWAMERFHIDAPEARAETAPASAAATNTDPDLAIDGLDLFPQPQRKHGDNVVVTDTPQGVETLIRGFAADFRRFALEWDGA